jgi:hypothetical protein
MSHGADATVECPACDRAVDPSVSGGWCTDPECGASRVAETASERRRLVTGGGTTENARAENGDEERSDAAEVWPDDGDVVGKDIRSIIMDTGGDEEDAVGAHRERVRFEYEDGGFYLVDLGQNATVVNGEKLEQGDRVPVEPGDRIDRPGVVRTGVGQG